MRYYLPLIFTSLLPTSLCRVERRATWCTASDKCWPSSSKWSNFNNSIGGRLVAPRPPAWPCHDPNYDEAACADARAHWSDSFWRSDQVGATQNSVWGSLSCDIDTPRNTTCEQGFIPTYSVIATGPDDISKAVKFASKYKVKLVIKNTGHDYLGRSSGAGSLSIWTHQLKYINFTDSFVANGCLDNVTGTSAVTVGAGTQWLNVYQAANERGVVVVGGSSRSVGAAGGWIQGGGHSQLGGLYGMGVDNVLQFTVVKADGNVATANSCQNQDLFWAMRGGGGGTWSIALDVTYKTHTPPSNIIGIAFGVNTTSPEQMVQFSAAFLRAIPGIMDSGLRGYGFWTTNTTFGAALFHPNSPDVATSNATLQPLWDWISNNPGAVMGVIGSSHPTFFDYFTTYIQDVGIGGVNWLGNRLVSRNSLLNQADKLAEYTLERPGVTCSINLVGGGAVNDANGESTGLNPQWRKDALVSWNFAAAWLDDTPPQIITLIKRSVTELTQGIGAIGGLSNAGYFNEADPEEPNWKQAWFGSHYKRLLRIKREVDPKGLFQCNRCVGSEQ